MRIFNVQMLAILAVTGIMAHTVSNANAEETNGTIQQVEHHVRGGGYGYNCPAGYSNRFDGDGVYRNYRSREGLAFLRKCHTSPGHGWCPPSAQPIQRTNVQYQRYYSNQYMGQAGPRGPANYPQIYMPTDTTQLGFYYQSVPTWQPRAGMIPPPPNPNMYHTRDCRSCRGNGCKHCRGGQQYGGRPVYYSTGNPGSPQPQVSPQPEPASPAIPPAPSKLNQASYEK
ncbi:hypothetical protein [uncultured Gimesia sp.]|uniref:hypothetical protein n=1 Tax=uncultured Gimesia sp. TaxID=1678688 RepID=UPI0030D8082A|tara:strand:+ start:111850 stop:112530 length:681 start_codon:yes stop_codon:yes gene_type:complete